MTFLHQEEVVLTRELLPICFCTACDQTSESICEFVTSYYKLIYFLYSEGFKKKVILISPAVLRTSATHAIDFKILP
jgi:hypothetical protein